MRVHKEGVRPGCTCLHHRRPDILSSRRWCWLTKGMCASRGGHAVAGRACAQNKELLMFWSHSKASPSNQHQDQEKALTPPPPPLPVPKPSSQNLWPWKCMGCSSEKLRLTPGR